MQQQYSVLYYLKYTDDALGPFIVIKHTHTHTRRVIRTSVRVHKYTNCVRVINSNISNILSSAWPSWASKVSSATRSLTITECSAALLSAFRFHYYSGSLPANFLDSQKYSYAVRVNYEDNVGYSHFLDGFSSRNIPAVTSDST